MNQSDSEHYAGQFEFLGYKRSEEYQNADIVLLNTCCIRDSAEQKIHGKIGELKHWKRENSARVLVIAGCMAQKDGQQLLDKYRQIDLILGTFYVNNFSQIIERFLASRQRQVFVDEQIFEDEFEGNILRQSDFSAWVPIMYGCNNYCAYCIVPYVRGKERSRPQKEIVHEIENAVKMGFKEFTLLGQNVNSYGKDFSDNLAFAKLLQTVDEIKGVERIRFMTSHPRDMQEVVIKTIAKSRNICEHFHLPIQAGSDKIIAKMNRGYTREQYLELVDMVRHYIPNASITTDIIVGFPGETQEDFLQTIDIVEKVSYDAAYTFMFSVRSGTAAATMPDQLPLQEKKERLKMLMQVQNKHSLKNNKALVGSVQDVLVEGFSQTKKENLSGRTRTNKIIVFPDNGQISAGQIAPVKITSAQTWILKGQLCNE